MKMFPDSVCDGSRQELADIAEINFRLLILCHDFIYASNLHDII